MNNIQYQVNFIPCTAIPQLLICNRVINLKSCFIKEWILDIQEGKVMAHNGPNIMIHTLNKTCTA